MSLLKNINVRLYCHPNNWWIKIQSIKLVFTHMKWKHDVNGFCNGNLISDWHYDIIADETTLWHHSRSVCQNNSLKRGGCEYNEMATLCFSLVVFTLFFLLKLKKMLRKRAHSLSLGRSRHYAVPMTKKIHLETKVQRQQTCTSSPAPVPNVGCNVEEPMDWTDSSGATRLSTLISNTNSDASIGQAAMEKPWEEHGSVGLSWCIPPNASSPRLILRPKASLNVQECDDHQYQVKCFIVQRDFKMWLW